MSIASDFNPLGVDLFAAVNVYSWTATVDAYWNVAANWTLISGPGNINGYPGVGDTALFDQGSADCTTGMAMTVASIILDGWTGTLSPGGYGRHLTITERFYINSGAVNWNFECIIKIEVGSKLEIGPNGPAGFVELVRINLVDATIELHRDFEFYIRGDYLLATGTIVVKGQTGSETLLLSRVGTDSRTFAGDWQIQDAMLVMVSPTYATTATVTFTGAISGNGVFGIRAFNNNNAIVVLSGGVFDCEVTLLDRLTSGANHSIVSFVNCEIKKLTNRAVHTRPRYIFDGTKVSEWDITLLSGLVYEAQQIGDLEITGSVTTSGDGSATFTQDAGLFVLFSGDDQLVDWPFGTETQCLIRSTGGTKEYKNINAATNGFLHGGDLIIGDGATIATRDSGIQGIESTTVSATGTLLIADGQPMFQSTRL